MEGWIGTPGEGAPGGANGRRRVQKWHLVMASGLAGCQDCSMHLPAWSMSTCESQRKVFPEGESSLSAPTTAERLHMEELRPEDEHPLAFSSSWGETERWTQALQHLRVLPGQSVVLQACMILCLKPAVFYFFFHLLRCEVQVCCAVAAVLFCHFLCNSLFAHVQDHQKIRRFGVLCSRGCISLKKKELQARSQDAFNTLI